MPKISTGILGLDEMLGGGFPTGRIILVRGGPGSGKTVFSLQFILSGVKNGERGVYVTLEEPLNLIKANMLSFGWKLENLENKGSFKTVDGSQLTFITSSDAKYGFRGSSSRITTLANQMNRWLKTLKLNSWL